MTFETFVKNNIIWDKTKHADKLLEAAIQTTVSPSEYLQGYLSKQQISNLYKKMFDLADKPVYMSVNLFLYSKYKPNFSETKICNTCKEEKKLSDFYSNGILASGKKKYKSSCKRCSVSNAKDKFNTLLLEVYGTISCKCCGYDKCLEALELHHLDPKQKDYVAKELRKKAEITIIKELKKCVLLCANCHRETHYGFHPEYLKT